MERKLIKRDQKHASEKIAIVQAHKPRVAEIYSAIIMLEPTITINAKQLLTIIADRLMHKGMASSLQELVEYAVVQKAGSPEFNGVKIAPEKLKNLLDFPDVTPVLILIDQMFDGVNYREIIALEPYVNIVDQEVEFVNDYQTLITSQFEHYTSNEQGNAILEKLEVLRDALNSTNDFLGNKSLPHYNSQQGVVIGNVTGLVFENAAFTVDVEYIRKYENRKLN